MRRLLIGMFILANAGLAYAGGPGTRGGIILNYPVGAQAIGMGEAFAAAANDVNAIFWNPAGLSLLEHREINGVVDANCTSVGYAQPIKFGVIGYGISILDGGEATIYYPEGATKTVRAQSDYMLMLSYAGKIIENLSIGGNLKMVHSELAEVSQATAFACDVVGLYRFLANNLDIGGVIQNIGSNIKYEEESDALPLNIKVGIAYRFNRLLLTMDINKPIENKLRLNVGAEYQIAEIMVLRAGYKLKQEDNKSGTGLTAGVGFKIRNYQLDYAYVPHQDLGDTHQISLLLSHH
ncbi:PorV/PorQ family protein [bacterium]|nr:PorV/PorQ family protein [bacterium]MBU1752243.1 PorV/PorQ family protein [bacterium]